MHEIFEKLCEEKGITPYRVCKETGITTATISNWKAGRYTPKQDKLQKIAEFLGVTIEYLMTGENPGNITVSNVFPIELKKFSMLGEIACGKPKYTNEDRESYVMAGTNIKADFCLRASGDSMINHRSIKKIIQYSSPEKSGDFSSFLWICP